MGLGQLFVLSRVPMGCTGLVSMVFTRLSQGFHSMTPRYFRHVNSLMVVTRSAKQRRVQGVVYPHVFGSPYPR